MTLARLLTLALLATGAALVVFAVACGSSKSGAHPGSDAASDDAADAGDSGPATTGIGVVTFSELPDAGGTFFAGFSETVPTIGPSCTSVDAGPCLTTTCAPPPASDAGTDAGSSEASAPPAPSAGTLTITGGVFGSKGASVGPDNGGTYLYVAPGTIFAPGDTLGVAAAGGAVPSFAQQTVVATPTMVLTAPTAGTGGKMTIPTAQPLVVSWTGGQAGAKTVLVATAIFTTGGIASTTCAWDASLGMGTVPSAALKPLAAANAETSGVSWYQSADNTFTVGTLAVTLSARVTQGSLASFQ